MTNGQMHALKERWRELAKRLKDLDWDITKFAADLRGQFVDGDKGDDAFDSFCELNLGMNATKRSEMKLRAATMSVTKDAKTYKFIGGFRQVKVMRNLTRRQIVDVLESCKVSGNSFGNEMRARGLLEVKPRPEPIRVGRRLIFPVKKAPPKIDPYFDAVTLAQYIARTSRSIPKDIQAVVDRYRSVMRQPESDSSVHA